MALRHGAALLTSALLGACGGGGGDAGLTPAQPAGPTVAGWYVGTTTTGGFFDALILDNGRIYGMLGNGAAMQKILVGTGTTMASGFNTTSGALVDTQSGLTSASAVATLTGTPKTSIAGSVTGAGVAATIASNYHTAFEDTPSLANVAGSYLGNIAGLGYGGMNLTLTVSPNGTFSGTTGSGCQHSGTLSVNASANVYDVTLSFVGCTKDGRMTGHALWQPATGAAPARLAMFASNNVYTDAWFYLGHKQP